MEDKNIILVNYCNALFTIVGNLTTQVNGLTTNDIDVNKGIIATCDVVTTSIRSQLVLIQNALDNYAG